MTLSCALALRKAESILVARLPQFLARVWANAKTAWPRLLEKGTAELSRALEVEVARRTQAEEAFRLQSKQLRQMASDLTMAEHRERQRIARLLHDDLQQLLVGMKLVVSPLLQAADPKVQDVGRELGDLINQCLLCSRSLTEELSPPILHKGGLGPALEWLVRWMAEKHHLTVVAHADEAAGEESLDATVLLFQAIRELLFNVVKHAHCNTACVAITHQDTRVGVEVTDEGVGFDPTQLRVTGGTAGGFGLFSLRDRLEYLGGGLEIESAPGKGSRFRLWLPVPQAVQQVDAATGVSSEGTATTLPSRSPSVNGTLRTADENVSWPTGRSAR